MTISKILKQGKFTWKISIFKSSENSLFVIKLFIDFILLVMLPLLDHNIDLYHTLNQKWTIDTLNLLGSDRWSFTLIIRPISVAIVQLGIVGVNYTLTLFPLLSTSIYSGLRTFNYSKVKGCSGSLMCLSISNTKSLNHKIYLHSYLFHLKILHLVPIFVSRVQSLRL